jgi:hypothetical protein
MRGVLVAMLLVGCAAQPKAGRPYKDAPVAVAVAAGTGSIAAGAATAAVVTVAVATVVVGAEQFPDPPAGTPQTTSPPIHPPDWCGSCVCFGKGKGNDPLGSNRKVGEGGGYVPYTRALCWQDCKEPPRGYTGYKCTGDKAVTWVE